MSFRDKIAALIPEDKRDDAKGILDALDGQLDSYAEDIKTLKVKLRERDGIKPEDYAAIEQERDTLKKQLSDVEKTAKQLAKERDEISGKYAETSKAARDYQRNVTVHETLSKHGIGKRSAEDIGDAISFIERLVQYDDSGNALVKYKDGETEKTVSLAEYAEKVYPGTGHAKRFIPDGNSGSGADRAVGSGNVKQMAKAAFDAMQAKERSAFMQSGGSLTE